jgi:hypothetical protein
LWKICGHKREEVTRALRKLNNVELQNSQSQPNIIRIIKCRIMGMGEAYRAHERDEACMHNTSDNLKERINRKT